MRAEPANGRMAAGKRIGTAASATQIRTRTVARWRKLSGWVSGIRRGHACHRVAGHSMEEYVPSMTDGRLWIDGAWVQGEHQAEVHAPWDGRLIRRVAQASAAQADQALAAAFDARERLQRQSTGKRREILEAIVAGLRARAEEMAQAICHE